MAGNKGKALKQAFAPIFKIENSIIDDFLAEDELLFNQFNEEIEDEEEIEDPRVTKIKNYYQDLMKNQSQEHYTNKIYQNYIDVLSEETWEHDPISRTIKQLGGGYDDYLTLKSESIGVMTEKYGKIFDTSGTITATQLEEWKDQRR